jgi:hypothetical protein
MGHKGIHKSSVTIFQKAKNIADIQKNVDSEDHTVGKGIEERKRFVQHNVL